MGYSHHIYPSPVGDILLLASEKALLGAWFVHQRHFAEQYNLSLSVETQDNTIIQQSKEWLEKYFDGKRPRMGIPYILPECSQFRRQVWEELLAIPYGTTISYKELGIRVSQKLGIEKISYQAIGTAVGHNPISIFIPCHRIVPANGGIGQYAAGSDIKKQLLDFENCSSLFSSSNVYLKTLDR